MTTRDRARATYARARGSGPLWRRVAALAIVAVAIYGIYSAYESSQQNGRRLDRALDALRHSNRQVEALSGRIGSANRQLAAFRHALKNAGVSPQMIRQIEQQAQRPSTPQPQSEPPPSPSPSHRSPKPHPSHHPHSPSPTPSQSSCTAYSPLDGRCLVRLPPHTLAIDPIGFYFYGFGY